MAESTPVATAPNRGWTPVPDPTTLTTEALRREVASLRELLEARLDAMDKAVDLLHAQQMHTPTETDEKVGHLKDVLDADFKIVEERFRSADTAVTMQRSEFIAAIERLRVEIGQMPWANGERIERLREVVYETFKTVDERFHGVETQFLERDTRTRDAASQTALAVQAALQAAKEAVGEQNKSFTLSIDKSEKSTSEQIVQQRTLLQTNYGSLNDKIIDQGLRLTRLEAFGLGATQADTTHIAQNSSHIQGNSFVLAVIIGACTVFLAIAGIVVAVILKVA